MISTHTPDLKIFASKEELAAAVAQLVNLRISKELESRADFHLALTGGTLGTEVSELLVMQWNEEPEKFAGLHLWWGDERFVPELSAQRNARPVIFGLGDDSPIHIHQVLPSDAKVDLEVAAKRFNADLFGIDMDLMLLGIGPDGHVASLFPGKWQINEERNAIPVSDSPKPPPQRVSFSMSKINSSKSVWLIANGAEKHEAIAKIIARDASIPASHVHATEETLLFVDRASLAGE